MLDAKKITKYYQPLEQVSLQRLDKNLMISKLKNVSQYKKSTITFQKLSITDLLFMCDYVYGYKYRAIDELINLYNKANLDLFSPAEFILANGKTSIITPPVVECHDNNYIVISGLTRLFYAYKQNIKDVIVAVVEDCKEDTPIKERYNIEELRIKDSPLDLKDIKKRNYEHYRFIERALRPSNSSLI